MFDDPYVKFMQIIKKRFAIDLLNNGNVLLLMGPKGKIIVLRFLLFVAKMPSFIPDLKTIYVGDAEEIYLNVR